MGTSLLRSPILSLLLLLVLFPFYSSSLNPLCNLDEASALLQFKDSFAVDSSASQLCDDVQPSYPKTESWKNGTDCCKWDGVTCDALFGHVIGLHLDCSWLYGDLHPNSTLFQLTHLQRLNLSRNFFNRSQMPSNFDRFGSLTHLDLAFSGFKGKIPSEISHLSKLLFLDLSYNQRVFRSEQGESLKLEPSIWRSFIQNVTGLQKLHLGGVDMSSIKPNSLSLLMNLSSLVSLSLELDIELQATLPNSILHLPNVQRLYLYGTQNLSIQLPKSNWSSPLRHLVLSNFDFSWQSPNSFGNLKSLSRLDLSACGFQGPIPQSFWNLTQLTHLILHRNNFSGEISSSLSALQYLIQLDLSDNNISGQIPFSISNFQHLIYLDLSNNYFSGQIPNVFTSLSPLESLLLSGNNIGGQLPLSLFSLTQVLYISCSDNKIEGSIPKNISGFSELTHLDLANNLLNGTIPSWCFSLPSLNYLGLNKNQLTGHIGEFSSSSLIAIDLSRNMLQNNIPKSMINLINLTSLSLSSNKLSGVLDFHMFSKFNHLELLDLSENRFFSFMYETRVGGTIPDFPNLVYFNLSGNLFHGSIPSWLNGIGNNSLSYLDLSHNLFSSFENFSRWSIQFLDLSFNLLEGDLPVPLHGVEYFSISNNSLAGPISSKICNASSLFTLDLSRNNLTGQIPSCLGSLPYLSVLDLQMNNLFGSMPDNISETNMFQTLKFNHNKLKGSLPRSLTHCKQLKVLDLGHNEIEDTFPNWLESLEELQVLVLRANHFHGMIAYSKSKHPFPKLRIFDISINHFRGPLPAIYIKQFKGMMDIDDGKIGLQYMSNVNMTYYDSVNIIMKGISMELTRILVSLTIIDLSNNKFEGKIPEIIGNLNSLIGLNLSHNRINGTIPSSLGDLKSLEWLDLSSNQLIGEIPKTMANLNYLSFLNLSQNQLRGVIPQGNQFNTFSNDSYEGNLGLCGPPLSKSCDNDQEEQQPSSSEVHSGNEFGFGWKPVAVGYGCGFLVGVVMGYLVFSTGRPQWLVNFFEGGPKKGVRSAKRKANSSRGIMN